MDTIKLTYAEAWEALQEGKEVFYNDFICKISEIDKNILYIGAYGRYAPFHSTNKLFTMKKEPEYEVLGLHDDWVEIEVFGLKAHQRVSTSVVYYLEDDGFVIRNDDRYLSGRVKFKGDHTKAKIRVTVRADKKITYEHL